MSSNNLAQVLAGWLACFTATSAALAGPTEVRGTWLTTTGPDHIKTGLNTESILGSLRDIGMNTVYVETWKNGYTNFPSQVMASRIGVDRAPFLGSRDLLQETLVNAHRENLIHVAWLEYGFSTQFIGSTGSPTNPISQYMLNQTTQVNGQPVQGWLLQDQTGNYGNASNGFAWMNPAVPEVRQFLIDLTLESVRNYDLDGVQFDDRLAWPREFGWDATTAAIYEFETGNSLPSSVNDAAFRAWRQEKVSLFASELYTALKAFDPDIFVSVSPSVAGFSDTQYNAVWSDWVADGLFDEFVPQVYRNNLASFRNDLPANVSPFVANNRRDDLVVGLRLDGGGGPTPLADLQQMIVDVALAEGGQLSGHSVWYSQGLINNQAAMQSFYGDAVNGPAPHPAFGLDHRPDPIVAVADGGNADVWNVTVTEPGHYRIALLDDGFWGEADVRYFEAGSYDLTVSGAEQVELLVSRRLKARPDGDFNHDGSFNAADVDALVLAISDHGTVEQFDLNGDAVLNVFDLANWLSLAGGINLPSGMPYLFGDANLDGTVDGVDFIAWNANKFSATAAWSAGDFNADGVVDGQDFIFWNSFKFTSADLPAVPEPISGWLFAAGLLWCAILRRSTVVGESRHGA